MNPEWFKSQRVLQCLGDESRFRVMTELVRGDRCVTELATLVGLSQSCTTRHLQVLERAGLVSKQRSGRRKVVRTNIEGLRLARGLLDQYEALWRGRIDRMTDLISRTKETRT